MFIMNKNHLCLFSKLSQGEKAQRAMWLIIILLEQLVIQNELYLQKCLR